jgi:DNA (cytosine-5)-methyltransferase 1
MSKPRLLDLFSGAGGAAMGYHRAGFEVVGVDLKPQPRYPFEFVQDDAIAYAKAHAREFDVIHASPPCQVHSDLKRFAGAHHVDLVPDTREALIASGLPYVIENVPGAPLIDPLMLCGSMFGLGAAGRYLKRHRLFESNVEQWYPGPCSHVGYAIGVYGGGTHRNGDHARKGYKGSAAERAEALGIDWMTRDEMAQAIPPRYTEYVGAQLMRAIGVAA